MTTKSMFKFAINAKDKKSKARGRIPELLAYRLASYHNLYFINDLVKEIRESILEGRLKRLRKSRCRLSKPRLAHLKRPIAFL